MESTNFEIPLGNSWPGAENKTETLPQKGGGRLKHAKCQFDSVENLTISEIVAGRETDYIRNSRLWNLN